MLEFLEPNFISLVLPAISCRDEFCNWIFYLCMFFYSFFPHLLYVSRFFAVCKFFDKCAFVELCETLISRFVPVL